MNGFEINKIIAAIIFTVLVVFGIDKVTDLIFYVEKPKEAAYVVEAPVAKTAVSTAGSDGLNIKDATNGNIKKKQLKFNENDLKAFNILGISVGLKWEMIQKKFKKIVKKFNPDMN